MDNICTNKNTHHKSRLEYHYNRLFSRWQTISTAVTIQEISDVLECHPRYTRVLLKSMVSLQWISWTGRAGRGAKGRLQCRVKNSIMSNNSIIASAIDTPENNITITLPHHVKRAIVSFYRSIYTIHPSDHTGRVERHLIRMIHAGLTRTDDDGQPVPDLASAIEVSHNRLSWLFILRSGLEWHNGDPVQSSQLLHSLQAHLKRPAFQHVTSVQLEKHDHSEAIRINLSRIDEMLAFRLADPVHALAHPTEKETGLGPFKLVAHNDHYLRLDRFSKYYGTAPLIEEVEYDIQARLPWRKWTTLILRTPDAPPEDIQQKYKSKLHSGFVYLMFNELKNNLTESQKAFLRAHVNVALQSFVEHDNVSNIDNQWANIDTNTSVENIILPLSLTLRYFWSPESELLMKKIKRQLKYWNCELLLKPVDANSWFLTNDWDSCDIGVSDLRFGDPWWFSVETRFCHSIMLRHFIPEQFYNRIVKIQSLLGKNRERYPHRVHKLVQFFIEKRFIHPLFSFKFEVAASERFKGVKVLSQGWPDFTVIDVINPMTPDEHTS